jgi:CPA1 family monovalent cation:H+ antiporter
MEFLEVAVLGLLAIAAAQTLGGRLRLAAPLLLVLLGIGVSLLPFIPPVEIEPEWILAGVLPPLLYSASAAMPAMDFRRDFTAISGLSVVLVVVSSVLLGLFFSWVIPDLSLAWGIALGAIVSPTDAVATTIVKRLGVSPRAVAILEGESLLNDATALVILRAGIAGAAAAVSLWAVFGQFVYAVVIAVVIGFVVGRINLRVRARLRDPAVNTVVSFTVPFLASIPAELLGASGLVAAVVAGLVTGRGAARLLSPQHRLSDSQNWRAIEMVLEGGVFLVMGLQLWTIVQGVREEHQGFGLPISVAAGALLLTVLIRTGYVALLLWGTRKRTDRGVEAKPRMTDLQNRLGAEEPFTFTGEEMASSRRARDAKGRRRELSPARLERLSIRLRRGMADIDYFLARPLGWREGVIVVWAGMRGAVTLAAAQTLPPDTPNRSLLILIAFLVAAGSLLLQGGTISAVVRWVKPAGPNLAAEEDEHIRVMQLLQTTATGLTGQSPDSPSRPAQPFDDASKRMGLAVIDAQRGALLDARDDGVFSSATLTSALDVLDADQISLELRGGPPKD